MSELGRTTGVGIGKHSAVELTPHEERVYERVLLGESNREIAARLSCTVKNVEYHMTKILRKFGEPSRAGLVSRLGAPPSSRSNSRLPAAELPWLRLVR